MKIKNILMFFALLTQANTKNYSSNPDFSMHITTDDQGIVISANSTLKFTHNGKNFEMHSARKEDQEYLQKLFAHPEIIKYFGDGKPREEKNTKNRVDVFIKRWEDGVAQSFFTIFEVKQEENEIKKEAVGHFALGGDEFATLYGNEDFLNNKPNSKMTHEGLAKKMIEILSTVMLPEYAKILNNPSFPENVRNIFTFSTNTVKSTCAIDDIESILNLSCFFNNEENKHTKDLMTTLVNSIKAKELEENEKADSKESENLTPKTNSTTDEKNIDIELYSNLYSILSENEKSNIEKYLLPKTDLITNQKITETLNKIKQLLDIKFKENELDQNIKYSAVINLYGKLIKVTFGYSAFYKTPKFYLEQNFYTSKK